GPRLVPQFSLLHEIRESCLLPRRLAQPCPARRVQAQGRALSRHPRGRPVRRVSVRRVGEAGQPIARRTNVAGCRAPSRRKRQETMRKTESNSRDENADASRLIDKRIEELADWRGETLARVRALIKEIDPEVVEEWKWRGVPVWSHAGIICTGETYKEVVK